MAKLTINLNNAISPSERDSLQDFEKAWLVATLPETEATYAVNLPAHMVRDLYADLLCFGPNHEQIITVVHCMEEHFNQVNPTRFLDFGDDEFVDSITDLLVAGDMVMPPEGSQRAAYREKLLSSFTRAVQEDIYGSSNQSSETRHQVIRLRYTLTRIASELVKILPPTYNVFVEAELYQNPCELDFIIDNMLWTLVGPDVFRPLSLAEELRPTWEARIIEWMERNS